MAGHDLALSAATHDLIIVDKDFVLINNAERVAQQIKITLMAFLGEWFLDQRFGVPYLESVMIKNPNMAFIRGILRGRRGNAHHDGNYRHEAAAADRRR